MINFTSIKNFYKKNNSIILTVLGVIIFIVIIVILRLLNPHTTFCDDNKDNTHEYTIKKYLGTNIANYLEFVKNKKDKTSVYGFPPSQIKLGQYTIDGLTMSLNSLSYIKFNGKIVGTIKRKNLIEFDWVINLNAKQYIFERKMYVPKSFIIKENDKQVGVFVENISSDTSYSGCYIKDIPELEIAVQLMAPLLILSLSS